jgi:hypothetical protein
MPAMSDDPEVDALVSELVAAGLLTLGTDEYGAETWTLTPKGAQVARLLAMSAETTDRPCWTPCWTPPKLTRRGTRLRAREGS